MRVFYLVGYLLIIVGAALLTLLLIFLGTGGGIPALTSRGLDGHGYYLLGTIGSVMLGWGVILVAAAAKAELRAPVALGTGIGFLALSLMRLAVALDGDPAFADFAVVLPGEVVLLFALSIVFLRIGVGFWGRLVDGYRSLRAAPVWVQVWVWCFLLPANLSGVVLYGLTNHPLPGWIALGFTFVVLTNMTLVLYERGISKLTSLPHLIPWVPLQIYTGLWLFQWGGLSPATTAFAWFYFIVIGISNLFDAYDTWRWFSGERDIMTREA